MPAHVAQDRGISRRAMRAERRALQQQDSWGFWALERAQSASLSKRPGSVSWGPGHERCRLLLSTPLCGCVSLLWLL